MIQMVDDDLELSDYPALAASRRFSRNAIGAIGAALERPCRELGESLVTVAAAGSLGRLEASRHSDVDCIVIVDDTSAYDAAAVAAIIEGLAEEFRRCGLRSPKLDGIYCRPIKVSTLLDPASRGSLDEPPAVFGSRMQMLLDARPLICVDRFASLRKQLVDWYTPPTGNGDGWTHLINDLSRYLHAYAVWQQFKYSRSADDGWYLRQAKMRSTRVVTFAALLFLLGESSRCRDGQGAWLLAELDRTPLGRLYKVFDGYADADFPGLLKIYDALHAMLSSSTVRRELIRLSPTGPADMPRPHVGAYAEIHELSEKLMVQLMRFTFARSDDWSSAIFRNWLL